MQIAAIGNIFSSILDLFAPMEEKPAPLPEEFWKTQFGDRIPFVFRTPGGGRVGVLVDPEDGTWQFYSRPCGRPPLDFAARVEEVKRAAAGYLRQQGFYASAIALLKCDW